MPIDTKEQLSIALKELLNHKSLDKITVRDIVERCGITRQTFYYHFADIFDLIDWTTEHDFKKLFEISSQAASIEEVLTIHHEYCKRNDRSLQRLLDSRYRLNVERLLANNIRGYLASLAAHHGLGEKLSASERDFLINYHTYALTAILVQGDFDKVFDLTEVAGKLKRRFETTSPPQD